MIKSTSLTDAALAILDAKARRVIQSGGIDGAPQSVRLIRGDAVELEPVRWAWRGYLPLGMLTILGGAPGCGKTTLALSFAAIMTRGGTWPDGSRCSHSGDVLIWSGEDGNAVTASRLVAAGADMRRVHFIDGIGGSESEGFDPGRHMPQLQATAEKLTAPRLLILDPIVSAVAGDSHKGAEVRRSLQPVVDLGRRLGCAILGITHFSKGTSGRDPVERVTGSIAFAALARLVLVAAKVKAEPGEDSESRRVMMRAKSNIGPDDGGFAYALDRKEVAPDVEGQCVRWLERLEGSAQHVLAQADTDPEEAESPTDDGVEGFVRGLLADGPMLAKDVRSDADGAGHAWRSVQAAATRLGVARHKLGMKEGWTWALGGAGSPRRRSEDSEDAPQKVRASSAPSGELAAPSGSVHHSCSDCMHLTRRRTCGEPVAAGLRTAEQGFGIEWPPEGHGAACAAFTEQ